MYYKIFALNQPCITFWHLIGSWRRIYTYRITKNSPVQLYGTLIDIMTPVRTLIRSVCQKASLGKNGFSWCGWACQNEVFTLPPYSTWIPHGFHHSIWNMFWLRAHSFSDLYSTWIPHGMVMECPNSTWNDGMSMWIPYGIISTIPCGFHGVMMEWPNSIWNYFIHNY